jgi:16S rRNA (guanine527-N7)-methyltransferase
MSDVAPPELGGLPPHFVERVRAGPDWEEDVAAYRDKLTAANRHMNLVGASTLGQFWERHFIDSAQLLWVSPESVVWADLGSGAGLPGLVLAILLKGRPGARVHLIDSMTKRCRFLTEVVDALALPAVVHNARAETLGLTVEMVTARACAPLDRLLGYAQPFFARGAKGLFLKGADVQAEVAEARKSWRFKSHTMNSLSDPRGCLLSIEELSRAGRP